MKIEKLSVTKDIVSCHYCDKSQLNPSGYGVSYPYDTVFQVTGNSIRSCFCEGCFNDFTNHGKNLLKFS